MLKEILKAKGLKQKFIANKMGVSAVTMSNWVKEKSSPNKKHLQKLCELLDVKPNEIVNL